MTSRRAGSGYLVLPEGPASGPGVLVLHSWWGLTPFFKQICDRLADEGFVALAPDLLGGRTTDDPETARTLLAETDMDAAVHLVRATVVFYGSQNIDMAPAKSPFLGHFAETDELVDEDELTLLEAELRLLDKDV